MEAGCTPPPPEGGTPYACVLRLPPLITSQRDPLDDSRGSHKSKRARDKAGGAVAAVAVQSQFRARFAFRGDGFVASGINRRFRREDTFDSQGFFATGKAMTHAEFGPRLAQQAIVR